MHQGKNETKSVPNSEVLKLTSSERLLIGFLAGAAEVGIDHPLWTLKTRLQCGYPFTLDPKVLYRGMLSSAVCDMGITAIQFGASDFVSHKYPVSSDEHINRTTGGIVGGAASTVIGTPVELGLTYQQKHNVGFLKSLTEIIEKRGTVSSLYTGNVCLGLRNVFYTCGFFSLAPFLKFKVLSESKIHDKSWSLLFGMVAGAICSVVSQPLDNIKTFQHQKVLKYASGSITEGIKTIYKTRGMYGFFIGTQLRALRVVLATGIVHTITDSCETAILSKKKLMFQKNM